MFFLFTRARGLAAMTSPLQGGCPRFESERAHFFDLGIWDLDRRINMEKSRRRNLRIVLLLIVFLMTFFAYMTYLSTTIQELSSDEASDIDTAYGNLGFLGGDVVHPPLGHHLLRFFLLFSTSKETLLLFNIFLLFPIFCMLLIKLSSLIYDDYLPGVFSCFFCLLVPQFKNEFLVSIRYYFPLFSILSLASLYYFLKMVGEKQKNYHHEILYITITVVGIYTLTSGFALLFSHLFLLLLLSFKKPNQKKRLKRLINYFFILTLPLVIKFFMYLFSRDSHWHDFSCCPIDTDFMSILFFLPTISIIIFSIISQLVNIKWKKLNLKFFSFIYYINFLSFFLMRIFLNFSEHRAMLYLIPLSLLLYFGPLWLQIKHLGKYLDFSSKDI